MTQRRVENSRVHFWTFSPVSDMKFLARLGGTISDFQSDDSSLVKTGSRTAVVDPSFDD